MQPQQIIFRDDDIAYQHTAHAGELVMSEDFLYNKFIEVDKLFIKYGVTHTVAVITSEIEKAERMVRYINEHPHIDVQLHCMEHVDYSIINDMYAELSLRISKQSIIDVFNKTPTVFYPPYNKVSNSLIKTAKDLNLITSYEKCSLSGYLKGHLQPVINFHYWADECKDLEAALKKYTGK